jgi:alpha-beta hydrolase superfamily lysophospholipase
MDHQKITLTTSDDLTLYVQSWTATERPAAVLLIVPGLGDHSGRFQNYVDYFAPRDWKLYIFDTRGHGRSDGPRGYVTRFDDYDSDIDRVVDIIRAAVRSDHATPPLFILGHSLGSLMVMNFARQHPDRAAGFIVTGAALQDALQIPGWKRGAASVLSRIAPSLKMNNGVPLAYLSRDPAVGAAFEADPLAHTWGTPRLATEAEAVRSRLYQEAPAWRAPLLMLHGGGDLICLPEGARRFASQTPPGLVEYREYPELYHEIHNEPEHAQIFQDIELWISQRLGKRDNRNNRG